MPITKEFFITQRDQYAAAQKAVLAKAQAEIAAYNGAAAVMTQMIEMLEKEEAEDAAVLEAAVPKKIVQEAQDWLESPEGQAVIEKAAAGEPLPIEPEEPCEGDCGMGEQEDVGY